MTIFKGSRYENSTVDFVATTVNGPANPIVFAQLDTSSIPTYYEHAYVQGERLDQLAARYLNDASKWWLIPQYNPQLEDFTDIPNGTILRIPSV